MSKYSDSLSSKQLSTLYLNHSLTISIRLEMNCKESLHMQALNAHPAMKIEVYTQFITETLFYNILIYLLQELRGKLTLKLLIFFTK